MYTSISASRRSVSPCSNFSDVVLTSSWVKRIAVLWTVLVSITYSQSLHAAIINVPVDQPTVQDAIVAASAGDTISIATGEFIGSAQLLIDKDLTIIGAGKTSTVLKPGFNTGSAGDMRAWILVDLGVTLHLSDLTIDGDTNLVYQAIRHKGNGTIDNVHFNEIKFNESGPNYQGVAVAAFEDGNVTITNCMFTEIGRIGVLYFGDNVQRAIFKGNTYTGKGPGDWLDYALDISAGAVVEVDSNAITNNQGVASSDGSGSAGILVTTFFGTGTEALITNNALCDNSVGIFVGFDASDESTVDAADNNFSGNNFGVVSTAPTVNAINNWWGDATGPDGEGPGSGDSVSVDVLFDPWLTMPNLNTPISGTNVEIICPSNVEISCEDDASPASLGEPIINAGGPVTVTYEDSLASGTINPILYFIFRTWMAFDDCGSVDTCLQLITVVDEDPPTIFNCPQDQTIYLDELSGDCDTTAFWVAPTATDNCDMTGFRGLLHPANWIQEMRGTGGGDNGMVDVSGAPNGIVITGHNNGTPNEESNLDFCITFPVDGALSFDWMANAVGGVASLNGDEPAFTMDGVEYILGSGSGCCITMNTTMIDVLGDSEFCFRVKSDGVGGDSTVFSIFNIVFDQSSITQISGPTSDSAPGAGDGTQLTAGTYTVEYEAVDGMGNASICDFDINVFASRNLLCKDINVSLDENCGVRVIPQMVISGDYACYDAFRVDILVNGISIGDSIGFQYLGQTLTYRVTDPSNGNSCWGEILVEDKYIPEIFCMDDTMNCMEFMFLLEDPTVVEHCQSYDIIVVDEQITNMDCDPNFLKFITRTYIARDASGNESEECSQSVWIERFPLGEVTLSGQDTIILCGSGFELDANGNIAPEYVSIPMLDTLPLYPLPDFFCNLTIEYEDIITSQVGCTKEILRTWKLTEWWCRQDDDVIRQQLITIVDTTGPVVTLTNDTIYGKAGRRSCDALVDMPVAQFEDCNGVQRVDMVYPGGFSGSQNGGYIRLPVGFNEVIYRVFDSCYNVTNDTVLVHVEDMVAPVAVCEQNTTVSLNQNGRAQLLAAALDDGSFDECAIDSFSVRRMTDTCDTGTDEWGPYVEFCCEDIGQDVMVFFRVTDMSGNHGTCMVNVQVQDKRPPVIIGLPTIRISCRFDFDTSNLEVFGKFVTADSLRDSIILDADFVDFIGDPLDGLVRDNCPPIIEEEVDMSHLDNCGLGYLVRLFTFTDNQGNVETHSQSIFFENASPFDSTNIIWPAHIDTLNVCGVDSFHPDLLPDTFAYPRFINEDECSLVGFDYDDEVIDPSQGNEACYKILRTWKVIDWCQKVNGIHRTWSYVQVIEVANTIAPTITSACSDTVRCVFSATCQPDTMVLIAAANDDCTDSLDLYWEYKIDLGNDGTFDITGTGNDATGLYPIDTHKIKFIVEDLCGNKDSCEYLFELRNCKGPTAYCMSGMNVELTPLDTTGNDTFDIEEAIVHARDFDANSGHPCGHPVVFSFSSDINDTIRVYNCDSLVPQTRNVSIYVTDTITGLSGICRTFVSVFDSNMVDVCPSSATGNVTGQLKTHDDRSIVNVMVELNNSGLPGHMTDDLGKYAFNQMPIGGIYDVRPEKDGDDLNGVSTADLVAIQRHLLGKKLFTSPYIMISGDVNNSQSVTAADVSELRKLILGKYSRLRDNTSWRFVDADFQFSNPQNPWKDRWPEYYHIEPFTSDMEVNFVGMKVGDVTGDVIVDGIDEGNQNRSTTALFTDDREFGVNETFKVELTLSELQEIMGYQFTLGWNVDDLRLLKVIPNSGLDITESHFNLDWMEKGVLTTCWHTTSVWHVPSEKQKVIFTLEFESLRSGQLSESMHLSGHLTQNIVVDKNGKEAGQMALSFGAQPQDGFFALYQNEPNPFSEITKIAFHLPESNDIRLTIFREDGALIKSISGEYEAGHHEVYIHRNELPGSGVLFYRLDTRDHTSTKKMVIID